MGGRGGQNVKGAQQTKAMRRLTGFGSGGFSGKSQG